MDKREAARIYDGFPSHGKNMPREEFIKQVIELTSPGAMQRDLSEIQRRKTRERVNRLKIDRGLN